MNHRRWISWVTLVIISILAVSPMAYGDVYWESKQVTKGIPGQKDGTEDVKTYYTTTAIRTDVGDQITIMDLDGMMMYQLDATNKTYTQVRMDKLEMPGMDEQQLQAMQEMMKQMMDELKITPTNETKKIAGYKCTKYNLTLMMETHEYWISREVKEYQELKAISTKMLKIFERNPMLQHTNIAGMMEKFDGFPVQMILNTMGGTITTTLTHIETISLDKKLFKVPAGYIRQQIQ